MIAIVVPVHNEESYLGKCLRSLHHAAAHSGLDGEPVQIFVALDACTDQSEIIAQRWGTHVVSLDGKNVGAARALGAQSALRHGARWLSFTDADTEVSPDWIAAQLDEATDAVCGTVEVADWAEYHATDVPTWHRAAYADISGHRHIHGANLGVCARAYDRVGGFQPLRSSEDVALVQALEAAGVRIAWSNKPRVTTSARAAYRAPDGFGARLAHLREQCCGTVTAP